MKEKIKIVIAGGGTGGHLYPGIAVARELQARLPNSEIHFVGSKIGLENKIIPQEGFPLHRLPVGGLLRTGRLSQLKTLVLMPFIFLQCLLLLIKIKPKIVLGIGGFAAGPFVLMASFFVRGSYIWEPNAHPGFTNRLLSRFVKTAFVVFENAKSKLKAKNVITVGLPIRKSIVYKAKQKSPIFRILVFGGSQGARAINNTVSEAVEVGGEWLQNVEIRHQTGTADFEKIKSKYQGLSQVQCFEYINNMAEQYEWADLVICRGGVGTISELIAMRKPSVIVPLPTASENHQQANAEYLVNAGAGQMLLQKDLTSQNLIKTIVELKSNPGKLAQMEERLEKLQRPNGSVEIVETMIKGIEKT